MVHEVGAGVEVLVREELLLPEQVEGLRVEAEDQYFVQQVEVLGLVAREDQVQVGYYKDEAQDEEGQA